MSKVDMTVRVIAKNDPNEPDGVAFHLEDRNGCTIDSVVFDKTEFTGMKHEDEHLVGFKLIRDQGMTLQFASEKHVALWVSQGTLTDIPKCPETQPACPNSIFYAEKSNAIKLTAINSNPAGCYFSFALNFVDPKSATPTKLITFDPVGQNKNGGLKLHDADVSYAVVLIGAATAAFIGYLAYRACNDPDLALKGSERHQR